ncbi:hypothetical protein ACHHYP_01841 [Achlya hypogyna]|uniref:Uncharacterized protein n=1 Tax=Achlya hypogyna TaxID=1202772 RepID=A0A1V9ZSR2_ACHHY|nr:hypothetical protein ACHHYP_01841 [Achlya hypogyna]
MGRSQLQYRRGRGRGTGVAGRGDRVPSHLRNLESNAYRFQIEEEVDENELEGAEVDAPPTRDLRYNPDIQTIAASSATGGVGYFQSKTEREWEADLAAMKPDDVALDFQAIGDRLKTLPPAMRLAIDPKYCIDLPQNVAPPTQMPPKSAPKPVVLAPTPTSIVTPPVATQQPPASTLAPAAPVGVSPPAQAIPPPPARSVAPVAAASAIDDELDELLNM